MTPPTPGGREGRGGRAAVGGATEGLGVEAAALVVPGRGAWCPRRGGSRGEKGGNSDPSPPGGGFSAKRSSGWRQNRAPPTSSP